MKMSLERNTASRRWHVYGKTVQKCLLKLRNLEAKKKDDKEATKIDLYGIVCTVKIQDKKCY